MQRQDICRFAPIFLFTLCLTNARTTSQYVQLPERDNFHGGLGNHLILIFAPGLRSPPKVQPQLPLYNASSRVDQSDLSSSDEDLKLAPKDDDAYYLYHVLRTTEENQNLDDRVLNTVEKTKSLLRPMLRSRCNQLSQCIAQCPPRKKVYCVKMCKVEIDVYTVCPPKPICRPPKCGRTMPPRW